MEIERVKTKDFDGFLLSDSITNMLMTMEESQQFYLILKEEFNGTVKKKWKLKK